jgi:ABC-2 type transport system permease protein
MNSKQLFTAYMTIVRKEVIRFLRIWPQTFLPSVMTTVLYFLIFGKFIGSQISDIGGVSYMAFIVPGVH